MHSKNSELNLDWGFSEFLDKGLIQVDCFGKIISINKKAEDLLEINSTSETNLRSFLYPAYNFQKGDADKFPVNDDYLIQRNSKSIAMKVRDLHNNAKVIVVEDISEEQNEEAAKSRFLSLVSHKLRTPVVALSYSMNLCLYKEQLGFSDQEEKDFMEQAYLKSFELSELIEKIINYTMSDKSSLPENQEYIIYNEALEDALKSYNSKYSSVREEYNVHYDQKCKMKLAMSREHFFIIIHDIIDNSLKFTDKEKPEIEISISKDTDYLKIDFDDNGPGIPEEFSEKIFEPFFQLEKYHTGMVEGIGLGLSLVKRIVSLYNGKIKISSSPASGVRVTIWLDVLT